jgi:tetratricopeptide (TPR) repeat protein
MVISLRHPEEARGLFQLALEAAVRLEAFGNAAVSATNLSDLALQRDRYDESLSYLDQALELARRIGARQNEWFALCEMTYALTMLGRWEEALVRLAEVPKEQTGVASNLAGPASGVLELYLHRGRIDEARRILALYESWEGRSGDAQAEAGYQAALAAVRFAEGDHGAAVSAGEQAFASRDSQGITAQSVKLGFLHAAEGALALGDRAKANELLEIVEALPPGLSAPFFGATAQRFRAHLAGDDPGADRHFTVAAAQFRGADLPFYLAVVQLEHGEWLIARGRPDDAQPLLAEARETFEHLQAQPWLERVDGVTPGAPAEVLA